MTATKIAELEARLEQAAEGGEVHREVVRSLVRQVSELRAERDRALACEAAALALLAEWRERVASPPPPKSAEGAWPYGGRCDLRCPTSSGAYCEKLRGHPGDCSWVLPSPKSAPERVPFPVTPACGATHTTTLICARPAGHSEHHSMDLGPTTPTLCWDASPPTEGERCGECKRGLDQYGSKCLACGGSGRSGGSR